MALDFCGKDLDSAGQNFKKRAIALGKKIGMAEGKFVIKNSHPGIIEVGSKI